MSLDKNTNLVQQPCKIQYQFIEFVESILRGSSNFHYKVTFQGNDWLDFYYSPASLEIEESMSRSNAGRLFEINISLNYPGEDDNSIYSIDDIAGPGLIIKLTWSNGKSKVIGDQSNPVRILPVYQSNPSKTGYTINIKHKSSHPAWWLEEVSGGGGIPD